MTEDQAQLEKLLAQITELGLRDRDARCKYWDSLGDQRNWSSLAMHLVWGALAEDYEFEINELAKEAAQLVKKSHELAEQEA